ncbi:MAG: CDP-alcohol phosphatidyltransferase family protein [Agarilytica sp.]
MRYYKNNIENLSEVAKEKDIFIIKLNLVDTLSICGLMLCLLSCGLALSGNYAYAIVLLFVAMLIDMLDGILARKFSLLRPFGKYLDSTIDTFDYLAVPPLILYLLGYNHWHHVLVLMLFVTCGVIRLAVFNQIGNIKDASGRACYLGMPVFWIVFILGSFYIGNGYIELSLLNPLLSVVLIIYSLLMVSRRPCYKFNGWKLVSTLIAAYIAVIMWHEAG